MATKGVGTSSVSIRAPAREATPEWTQDRVTTLFRSAPPRGKRRLGIPQVFQPPRVSIRAPAREATRRRFVRFRFVRFVSIRAPAREAT